MTLFYIDTKIRLSFMSELALRGCRKTFWKLDDTFYFLAKLLQYPKRFRPEIDYKSSYVLLPDLMERFSVVKNYRTKTFLLEWVLILENNIFGKSNVVPRSKCLGF